MKTTPKDFFLWAGAMVTLYVSVFSFLTLLFEYIDRAFPDALSYVDPYSGTIRFSIASLVVLFPVFLVLMRLIRADIEREPAKSDLWVRRWALMLTLFVAGATVAIDLITLINSFLGGDMTASFLLKTLAVFLVAGAGFLHFLADMRGYWQTHRAQVQTVGWGAGVAVLATVIAGFFIMGSPWTARLMRFDDTKVNDLQTISWQVVSYWQAHETLPTTLADLNDPLAGYQIPNDPQMNVPYEYAKTGDLSFELCATFNAESRDDMAGTKAYPTRDVYAPEGFASNGMSSNDSWYHEAGRTCFDRTIDPQKYQPIKKQ